MLQFPSLQQQNASPPFPVSPWHQIIIKHFYIFLHLKLAALHHLNSKPHFCHHPQFFLFCFVSFPHLNHFKQHSSRDCPKPSQQKGHQDLKHHGADCFSRWTRAACIIWSTGSTGSWCAIEFNWEQKVCLRALVWLILDTIVDCWNILIWATWGWVRSVLVAGASTQRDTWG